MPLDRPRLPGELRPRRVPLGATSHDVAPRLGVDASAAALSVTLRRAREPARAPAPAGPSGARPLTDVTDLPPDR